MPPLARLMRANAQHFRLFLWLMLALFSACPAFAAAKAVAPASSASRTAETEYQKIADRYHSVNGNPSSGRKREEWLGMLQEAQQLCRKHSSSRIAPSCLHLTARMHRSMYQRFKQPADLNQAVSLFKKVASQFPESSEAVESLYAIAQIEQTNGNLRSAAKIYYDIVRNYPFSSRKASAEKQLGQLKVIAESLAARKNHKNSGQKKTAQMPPKPAASAAVKTQPASDQKNAASRASEIAAASMMPAVSNRKGPVSSEKKSVQTKAASLKSFISELKIFGADRPSSSDRKEKTPEPKTPSAASGQVQQARPSKPASLAVPPKAASSGPAIPADKSSVGIFGADRTSSSDRKEKTPEPKTPSAASGQVQQARPSKPASLAVPPKAASSGPAIPANKSSFGIFGADRIGSSDRKEKMPEPKTPSAANGQVEQARPSGPASSTVPPKAAFSETAAPSTDNSREKQQKMVLPVPAAPLAGTASSQSEKKTFLEVPAKQKAAAPAQDSKTAVSDKAGNDAKLKKIAVSALKVVSLVSTTTPEDKKTDQSDASSSAGSRQDGSSSKIDAASSIPPKPAETTEASLAASQPAASTAATVGSEPPKKVEDSVGSGDDPASKPSSPIVAEPLAEKTEVETATEAVKPATTAKPGDASGPVEMLPVQYWASDNYSRVAIGASGPAEYNALSANKDGSCPERFHVDFKQSHVALADRLPIHLEKGMIKRIKADQLDAATVRVSFDMKPGVDCKVFSLNDPFRVVVDVRAAASSPSTTAAKPAENVKEERKTKPAASSQSLTLAQQLGLGIRRIVVDPGHGGKDSGATGFGLLEKQIALDVAKNVQEILRKEHDYEVLLTREDDIFLPLEERTAIANTKGADLFLSIHVNAHPKNSVKGVETFYLNLATNPEAMRVAALENATSTRSMSEMQDILSNLMKNTKINESSQLASFIQTSMIEGLSTYRTKDLGVKQAPFYVLIGAEMPAVLAEISYLSNNEEASLLKDEQYLKTIAKQLAAGVISYIEHRRTAALNL